MGPREMVARVVEQARRRAWTRRQIRPGTTVRPIQASHPRPVPAPIDPAVAGAVPASPRAALLAAAEQIVEGHWELLGVDRHDLAAPDWFLDPISQRRAPSDRYAFSIQHRSEAETGNVKQVWELSRHQHLTVLAAAYFVSGDVRYAELVDRQLRSWWQENPFLSGIHWTSGIELGLRLIAWTWIRRLLDGWPPVAELFERNEDAARQLYWHQSYLAAFPSVGTSANNHAVAEAAGLLVAACAFPWFDESARWRDGAVARFERVLADNTFATGVNRELASEYHGFVTELAFTGALEAQAAGVVLDPGTWRCICRMTDAAAALVDVAGRPPRQGDGDDGIGLRLDGSAPEDGPWAPLLGLGAALFGPEPWWPSSETTVFSSLLGALDRQGHGDQVHHVADRPVRRPSHFADAGLTLLRTKSDRPDRPEIWCRGDSGPHGFLATAAHAHADALSIEVRHDGVDVLADPGTYCYHGEPAWRSYFRSTIAHNTMEIDGQSQSAEGGPFLWLRHANARELDVQDIGDAAEWTAEHDGYLALHSPARHRRRVWLDRISRSLDIVDEIGGSPHDVRLAFHLGPEVEAEMDGESAVLRWPGASTPGAARLELPPLRWSVHRGETNPILGWYSPGLGRRVPAITLLGRGRSAPDEPLITRLEFLDLGTTAVRSSSSVAISWSASDSLATEAQASRAETG